jgi:4-amino-4-deoxy-L-arabinose transferase-like glycosyltransferase
MRLEAPPWPDEASDAAIADDAAHRSPAAAAPAFAWLAQPAVIVGLIALYLLGHFILRLMLSPTLGIDDAEQILFAQRWDFGYRFRQPPLFTWMLLPVVDLIGPGVLAISIVRYALLAITFVVYYLTARLCLHDRRLAGLAVLSLATIYVFAYYAHHDLTHTTALGAMIALALYVTARLARNPSWTGHGVAGLVCGLGMLAKWNFAMLAAGLPLACLLDRRLRTLVLSPGLIATIAVMAAVLTPTALWMAAHGQSIEGLSSDILSRDGDASRAALWLEGAVALLRSILLFPEPFLPIFLLLFGRSLHAGLRAPAPQDRTVPALPPAFFGRLMLIMLGLHALLIPLFGAVNFTERWLHPALMCLPIYLFALAERGPITKRQIALYLVIIAILVAAAAGARLYRYAEGADDCGRCREFAPFAELADGLRAAGFAKGTIVADGMHIGGNLRMLFAESRVIDPAFPRALWPDAEEREACLLVWQDDGPASRARRELIRNYASTELGLDRTEPTATGRLEALLLGSASRRYALAFELYQENAGGCR